MRRALVILVGALALAPGPARGDDEACPTRADEWLALRGTLQPGRACGSYLLTTDGSASRFSSGEVGWREPVELPYQLSVTLRRIGAEAGRSLSIVVLGGVILIKDGAIGFYAWDEGAFAAAGWQPVADLHTHDEHTVRVAQSAAAITVQIDGAEVASWSFAQARTRGRVGLAFKGATGHRSRLAFRGFAVRSDDPR